MIATGAKAGKSLAQARAAGNRTKISAGFCHQGNSFHRDFRFLSEDLDDARVGLVDGEIIHFASWFTTQVFQRPDNTIQLGDGHVSELLPLKLNIQSGILRDSCTQ